MPKSLVAVALARSSFLLSFGLFWVNAHKTIVIKKNSLSAYYLKYLEANLTRNRSFKPFLSPIFIHDKSCMQIGYCFFIKCLPFYLSTYLHCFNLTKALDQLNFLTAPKFSNPNLIRWELCKSSKILYKSVELLNITFMQ